jgi:hypothetical protein
MDLRTTIRELYEEKQRIEEAIASLEELIGAKGARQRLRRPSLYGRNVAGGRTCPPRRGAKCPAG